MHLMANSYGGSLAIHYQNVFALARGKLQPI